MKVIGMEINRVNSRKKIYILVGLSLLLIVIAICFWIFSRMFFFTAKIDNDYMILTYQNKTYTRLNIDYTVNSDKELGLVDRGDSPLGRLFYPCTLWKTNVDQRFLVVDGPDGNCNIPFCLLEDKQAIEQQLQNTSLPVDYALINPQGKKTSWIENWVGDQLEELSVKTVDEITIPYNENTTVKKLLQVKKFVLNRCLGKKLSGVGIFKINEDYFYINECSRGWLPYGKGEEIKGYRLSNELQQYFTNTL